MGQASYIKKLKVSTDNSTWVDVPATSPSLTIQGDVLDDTTVINSGGYKSTIIGLINWSVSCDSNYEASDTTLKLLFNNFVARTSIYMQYLIDGTTANGFTGKCNISQFDLAGDVSGLETASITLQNVGALTATT